MNVTLQEAFEHVVVLHTRRRGALPAETSTECRWLAVGDADGLFCNGFAESLSLEHDARDVPLKNQIPPSRRPAIPFPTDMRRVSIRQDVTGPSILNYLPT